MNHLDIFAGDAFSVVSLTEAINKLPYVPARIGQMGLFRRRGVTTTKISVEEKNGVLRLLPTKPRGSAGSTRSRPKRTKRVFEAPHIPHDTEILADDLQGVTAFGSGVDNAAARMEAVSDVVNEELTAMRQDHEVTHEHHRIGAIRGQVLDADGTTVIHDLFQEFGITQTSIAFNFGAGLQDMKQKSLDVIRTIRNNLGGTPLTGVHAFCGDDFFDAFVSHESVKGAFERFQENQFARTQQALQIGGFEFAGITWENYRGSVGNVDFIPTGTARFIPVGSPGLFTMYDAPADFVEAVNTPGKPTYAKQERMKWDKGVEIHTQSNPLAMCNRPAVLVEGVLTTS